MYRKEVLERRKTVETLEKRIAIMGNWELLLWVTGRYCQEISGKDSLV